MARNPQRVYGYPVFDPASLVWQRLTQDAADMGVSVHTVMVMRLGDYYKGRRDGVPAQVVPNAPTDVAPTSDINKNALAAAQAWGDDDEDSPTEKMRAV